MGWPETVKIRTPGGIQFFFFDLFCIGSYLSYKCEASYKLPTICPRTRIVTQVCNSHQSRSGETNLCQVLIDLKTWLDNSLAQIKVGRAQDGSIQAISKTNNYFKKTFLKKLN